MRYTTVPITATVAILLTCLFAAPAAGFVASDDVTVDAGEETAVEYDVIVDEDDEVTLDIEDYPDGWSVEDNSTDGGAWSPDDEVFIWLTADDQVLRPSVDVSVPENATSGVHNLTAELTVDDGDTEETETETTEVTVENGTVTDEGNVSPLTSVVSVEAGGTATADYALDIDEDRTVVFEVVEYPENWTVDSADDDGAAWSSGDESFVWLETDGSILTPSLELSVPDNASAGSHELTTELRVEDDEGEEVTTHRTAVDVEEADAGGDEGDDGEEDTDEDDGADDEGDDDGGDDEGEGLPGFGFVAAVLALVSVALVSRFRHG